MHQTGMLTKTHYEILSVKEDASFDEIRSNYKVAVLNSHPDKIQSKVDASNTRHELKQDFLDIQRAWEILSDAKRRANYDNNLRTFREAFEVAGNEVDLGDMTAQTVGGDVQELLYQCRCGDYFSITSLDLKELGILLYINDANEVVARSSADWAPASVILPCSSCSLKLRLNMCVYP